MKPQEMLDTLIEQSKILQTELLELERTFNTKKEQFIRTQGAIEALEHLTQEEEI